MLRTTRCPSILATAALLALALSSTASAAIISIGGTNSIGTVHYLNENVLLGTHSGGNSLPDISVTQYVTPAANASFGSTTGSNGNNGILSGGEPSGIGVYTGGSPMTWRANLSTRVGTPNLSNQSYAIKQIRVSGRSSGGTGESDGLVTVLFNGSPVAGASSLFFDFPATDPVTVNFTGSSVIGQKVQYVSSVPNGVGSYSFSEIQASGQENLLLASDTLLIEFNGVGNDFVNVQGTATLNGVVDIANAGGNSLTLNTWYSILTASSIVTTGMTMDTEVIYQIISGGQGQILQVQIPVPEPSTLALLGLGAIGLAVRTRRRRTVA